MTVASAAWEQVGDVRNLQFEDLDRFLALRSDPPTPWVLVDLSHIWVAGEGVTEVVRNEIESCALQAFRTCADSSEWIWAWNAPDDYSDELYRFWPHRFEPATPWRVWFYPDGDDQLFVSRDFSWGIYAIFQYRGPESWGLQVFGSSLLEAFGDEWPAGWSNVVDKSDD